MNISENKFELVVYQIKHNSNVSNSWLDTISQELLKHANFPKTLIEGDRNLFQATTKLIVTYALATCSYESLSKYIHNRNLVAQSIKQLITGELKFNNRNSLSHQLANSLSALKKYSTNEDTLLRKVEVFVFYISMEFSLEVFEEIINRLFLELGVCK